MEFFPPGKLFDFMRYRRIYMTITVSIAILSFIGMFYPGLNYGTDFLGGTEIEVQFKGTVRAAELRGALEALHYERPDVVSVVSHPNQYIIRVGEFSSISRADRTKIRQTVTRFLPEGVRLERMRVPHGGDRVRIDLTAAIDPDAMQAAFTAEHLHVLRVVRIGAAQEHVYEAQMAGLSDEMMAGLTHRFGARGPREPERISGVGPRAGAQLRDAAVRSLLYTIAFIMVYVAFRFDLRYAPGCVIAMVHDAMITVGAFVVLQKEFNLTIVAAVLTIVGYSVMDTIVVYDRIRENIGRHRDKTLYELINISTSQTLSRTIITSGVTLLSISAFFIWGTDIIRDLSFALFVGILIGTYSSIWIAAPVTEWMDRRFFSRSKARAKQARAQQREA
jgi:preprotein translocase subunit SecF